VRRRNGTVCAENVGGGTAKVAHGIKCLAAGRQRQVADRAAGCLARIADALERGIEHADFTAAGMTFAGDEQRVAGPHHPHRVFSVGMRADARERTCRLVEFADADALALCAEPWVGRVDGTDKETSHTRYFMPPALRL